MKFQPSVFVGSSKEGLPIAEMIIAQLNGFAQLHLWKDVFEYNIGTYETLSSQVALYDYAILVATADDITRSRKQQKASARDNVLFEFGLFAGGLGRSRVFYVVEEKTRIPSDLVGTTLPMISERKSVDFHNSVISVSEKIKKHISDKEDTFDFGFLPSTALAFGYFKNFVERTVERLLEDRKDGKIFHLENGETFSIKELKATILIPDDLTDNMFSKVKAKRLKSTWQKLKVDPKDVRDYDFSIDVTSIEHGLMHFVDIPYTLNALDLSIAMYAQKNHLGKGKKEKLLETREVRNFKRVLDYLISQSSITCDIVEVEIVDI